MAMDRAYSLLTVKAVNDEARTIEGWATTPAVDRVGDIVEPMGVKFQNPLPLLWMHRHDEPVGTVNFKRPTKQGVQFVAHLPKVDEVGTFRDRVNEAWDSVKHGAVRAVSIGFRALDGEVEALPGGGARFKKVEVLELSLVSVPANHEATITNIKLLDQSVDDRADLEDQYPRTLSHEQRQLVFEGLLARKMAAFRKAAGNGAKSPATRDELMLAMASLKQMILWQEGRIADLEKRLGI